MIIAQARSGRFTVVSRDPAFSLYDVAVLAG
jgi:PIN domain nuclease of toxin-antitoxin system